MTFPVEYNSISSDASSVTLHGICDIRHIQPERIVTINSVNYPVVSYAAVGSNFTITLGKTDQVDPPDSGTFELYVPKFFHGTPVKQENELKEIQDQRLKTPMIYLMEPFTSDIDNSWESSIYSRTPVTICFLTEADVDNSVTDELHYNAVKPMYNLCQDFVAQMIEARMFYTDELQYKITHHAKFGINVRNFGTKETLFTENLSGVSLDIRLELYCDQSCCQDQNFLLTSQGMFLQVD